MLNPLTSVNNLFCSHPFSPYACASMDLQPNHAAGPTGLFSHPLVSYHLLLLIY